MQRAPLACVFVLAVTCGALLHAGCGGSQPTKLDLLSTDFEVYKTTPEGKPICPSCGRSDQLGAYLFGLVKGGVSEHDPPYILGGCVVHEKCPQYKCKTCGTNFGLYYRQPAEGR